MKTEDKFETSFGRLFAAIFDIALYGLLFALLDYLLGLKNVARLQFDSAVAATFGIYIYKIIMHAAFGKTLGKMLFGIVLLNNNETHVALSRAILREIISLSLIFIIGIIAGPILKYQPNYDNQLDKFLNSGNTSEILIVLSMSIMYSIWEISVFISMLISPMRISVQDGLSKTLVIKEHPFSVWGILIIISIIVLRIFLHHLIGIV